MQATDITTYLVGAGFQKAIVNGQHIDVLLKRRQEDAYVVAIVDCKYFPDMTVSSYENILRGIRNSLYQYEFQEVHLLSILCTETPEKVKDLLSSFGEHWVVDLKERRLLIYENQANSFLNVKEQIEEALLYGEMVGYVQEQKAKYRFYSDNLCTLILVLINILAFLWTEITGSSENAQHMISCGAMYSEVIGQGLWQYRLFTSMFLHFGIDHLLSNMFMLVIMGRYVEKRLGKISFLVLYLGSGLIGNIVSMYEDIYSYHSYIVSAGASGAVFGILGAILWITIKNRGRLEDLGMSQLIFMVVLSLYNGMVTEGVDAYAHIGGFIGGVIIAMFLYKKAEDKEEQVS